MLSNRLGLELLKIAMMVKTTKALFEGGLHSSSSLPKFKKTETPDSNFSLTVIKSTEYDLILPTFFLFYIHEKKKNNNMKLSLGASVPIKNLDENKA